MSWAHCQSVFGQRVSSLMETFRSVSIRISRCLLLVVLVSSSQGTNATESGLITPGPAIRAEREVEEHLSSLPGLISSPPLLAGNRRWQMYTKYVGTSAESVCWSPDGLWLAVANGMIVRLFDFQSGKPELMHVLVGHNDTIKTVEFNMDGDRLATGSLDGTVRIWNAEGREQFVYRGHEDAVLDVSWHPDGQRLASGGNDGTVRIWSIDGTTIAVLSDHEAPVNSVAWNPNGQLLASGCENKTIRYWDAEGSPGLIIEAHIGPVRGLQWNHQGTKLVSCDYGIESSNEQKEDQSHLKIWDTDGQLVSSVFVGQPLTDVCWSPGGTRVLAGSWRNAKMWVPGDPQAQIIVSNGSHNGVVKIDGFVPVAWRPSGDLIAAGSTVVSMIDESETLMTLRDVVLSSVGLSPDGKLLGVGRGNATFDIFDSDGHQRFHSSPLASTRYSQMHAFCWNPDGKTFIPGVRYLLTIQQFDAAGDKVANPVQMPGDTRSVAWSRDGRYVAAAGDRQVVSLLDLETNEVRQVGEHPHGITQVRFRPNQTEICSAGFDGCIRFWSLDGNPLRVFETVSAPICSLAFSSDGEIVASGHQDNRIRLWNKDGELLNIVGGHGGHIETLEFSPDGTLLASGSRDQSVRLWKRDGTAVAAFHGHSGAVYGLTWTPDGRAIYSCADDGTIRRWNAETGIAEWQTLLGETNGYVTVDAQGNVKHGDEKILESDFVFFAEDDQRNLIRSTWLDIRSAVQATHDAPAN